MSRISKATICKTNLLKISRFINKLSKHPLYNAKDIKFIDESFYLEYDNQTKYYYTKYSEYVKSCVKNESFFSRMYSFLWFINIFKKMSVAVIIDGDTENPHILQARKEPYLLDITPGQHEILFTDPRAASKSAYKKFCPGVGCAPAVRQNR